MLNLALYSDQIIPENSVIDARLVELLEARAGGYRIGYIPSAPEPDRRFFNERKAYYSRCRLRLSVFYDLDIPHSAEETGELLACDAIHLSGGHTRGFLERLRQSGLIPVLRDWVLSGGILIGASAGSILMTPTIATDSLFSGGNPEETVDGEALDLVPFEFFPHLGVQTDYLPKLIHYSRHISRPIIACRDGEGVVLTRGKIEYFGTPLWIEGGVAHQANQLIHKMNFV
ncbi:peptidase E [Labrys sp. KNU-23]|uniref:Type 1 glutamine amidotransferase-like domain-containing protein n=1 Tax=Labrys sp. KNU-23 TaxID=2789216 RepID=UPI0011F02965|nr:Type 1 glutamine amidotransferase-like domain-containing protein [Labrys sp. KNU-23]QEN84775.1 peptidase E [Labrys sp. KNU-23]